MKFIKDYLHFSGTIFLCSNRFDCISTKPKFETPKSLIFSTFIPVLACFLMFINLGFSQHSMMDKVQQADMVIEGKVIHQNSLWNKERTAIYTKNEIEIYKIFKGNITTNTMTIITLGGITEEDFQIVSHSYQLGMANEGIFFIKESTAKSRYDNQNYFLSNEAINFQISDKKFKAHHGSMTYENPKYLYQALETATQETHRKIANNSIEKAVEVWLNNNLKVMSSNEILIEFSFENIQVSETDKVEFDIMAKSNQDGIKFAASDVYIQYSTEAFGSSIVTNDKIEATKETIVENDVYTLELTDETTQIVKFLVNAGLEPNELYSLSNLVEKFLHIKLDIENIYELASLSFEGFLMDNQSLFYDEISGQFISFDKIAVENPVFPFRMPMITSFSPNPITTGTGANLEIIGKMFGDTKGKVRFPNADDEGGMMEAQDSDVTWSDELIIVRMPSMELGEKPAGSGIFQVIPNGLDALNSPSELEVKYAVLNAREQANLVAHRVHLASPFNDIDFFYSSNLSSIQDGLAVDILKTASDKWKCATGVNWEINGMSNSVTASADDATNLIYMAGESEFIGTTANAIAFTVVMGRVLNCNNVFKLYIQDRDIAIRASVNWVYENNVDDSVVPLGRYDFLSNVLHELGHAHHLVHVNNSDKVMYNTLFPGTTNRNIQPHDKEGGLNVLNEAQQNITDCISGSTQAIVPIAQIFPEGCGPNSVEELFSKPEVTIFPTLFNSTISIKVNLKKAENITINIYDLMGKKFTKITLEDYLLERV